MVVIPFPLEKVLISGFVYLQTSMHNHNKNGNIQDQGYKHGPIEIHDDVWLGSHVVVCQIVFFQKDVWLEVML